MKTIQLYSFNELNEQAKERALETLVEAQANDPYLLECDYQEIHDSMKAITAACGVKTLDYEFGPYCQSYKWKIAGTWIDEYLEGHKAIAHFLKTLIENGYTRPGKFSKMKFPGVCGFTGTWSDEMICESIYESLMDGETLKTAFDNAAGKICEVLRAQYEWLTDPETIRNEESFYDCFGECYDKDGNQII